MSPAKGKQTVSSRDTVLIHDNYGGAGAILRDELLDSITIWRGPNPGG